MKFTKRTYEKKSTQLQCIVDQNPEISHEAKNWLIVDGCAVEPVGFTYHRGDRIKLLSLMDINFEIFLPHVFF